MRLVFTAVLVGLGTLLVSSGCGGDVAYNPSAALADRPDKAWDITHALNYEMMPAGFQFGLGPFAVKPILDPHMLSPGDVNYPRRFDTFRVMGTSLNGFTRAYPINVMNRHEVVNEQFGEAPRSRSLLTTGQSSCRVHPRDRRTDSDPELQQLDLSQYVETYS